MQRKHDDVLITSSFKDALQASSDADTLARYRTYGYGRHNGRGYIKRLYLSQRLLFDCSLCQQVGSRCLHSSNEDVVGEGVGLRMPDKRGSTNNGIVELTLLALKELRLRLPGTHLLWSVGSAFPAYRQAPTCFLSLIFAARSRSNATRKGKTHARHQANMQPPIPFREWGTGAGVMQLLWCQL